MRSGRGLKDGIPTPPLLRYTIRASSAHPAPALPARRGACMKTANCPRIPRRRKPHPGRRPSEELGNMEEIETGEPRGKLGRPTASAAPSNSTATGDEEPNIGATEDVANEEELCASPIENRLSVCLQVHVPN